MKQLQREYASVAGRSEANWKARAVRYPRVSSLPSASRVTEVESKQGAERVEDWSSVRRLGAVETTRVVNCGNQTVLKMTEKFGHITGQVGMTKVADTPRKTCKQIMQNSYELAKSRRHLTVNVENKWLSNLHESVNSANFQNANTFSGLYQNQGSVNYRYRSRCHLMPFAHKWLHTSLVNPKRLCISLRTRMCLLEPFCTLKIP